MSISDFLRGGAGIAAIAGSGGLAAGLGLAGSLFGQSSSSRLRESRDSAKQAAREKFDPSIYQPMHTQGQTMATEGLGRMEDIARERTVASLFRQQPQATGSSARDIALQQQQSGMARQALAGFEGQLTQADIERRQQGELMATQAETQMRQTEAERGSAINNIESMYQAERGARRDKTIGAIFGTVGQLGASYLMGRGMRPDSVDGVIPDAPELPVTDVVNPSIGDQFGMQQGLESAEASIGGIFDNLDPLSDDSAITSPFAQAEANISQIFGNQSFDYSGRMETPQITQQQESGPVTTDQLRTMYAESKPERLRAGYETGMSPDLRRELRNQSPEAQAYMSEIERITGQPVGTERKTPTGMAMAQQVGGAVRDAVVGGVDWLRGLDPARQERNMRQWAEEQGIQTGAEFSAGDTGEMPEWLRESNNVTVDPTSPDVQNTFSSIESEYNLPEGILRGIMMTETSGRPEFAMDYHYGEDSGSTAFGMFGITRPTAMDAGFGVDSLLTQEGQSLKDVPWQDQARFAAQYLSALIEREGSLERALDRYGTGIGSGYNQRVMSQINL